MKGADWDGQGRPGRGDRALTPALPPEFPFNESPVVTSTCASSCEATDPDSIGAAHPIFCCFHDLCNSVGAARLSAGALAPLGAVVLSHLLP